MNAAIIDEMRTTPGYRRMILPIEEASGPLLMLRDIVEEEPLTKVMRLIDLGLALYAAEDTLFVIRGDLLIYREMVERIEKWSEGDGDDDASETEDRTAA